MHRRRRPVRPLIAANFFRCNQKGCTEHKHHEEAADKVPEENVKREDVDFGNYIVGPSPTRAKPKIMKSPREMSAAEMEEHMATYLPYSDSCPHCVAGKRCNNHHRTSTTPRDLPLLHADYGYLRDSLSDDALPFLVAYVKPYRVYFCHSD